MDYATPITPHQEKVAFGGRVVVFFFSLVDLVWFCDDQPEQTASPRKFGDPRVLQLLLLICVLFSGTWTEHYPAWVASEEYLNFLP